MSRTNEIGVRKAIGLGAPGAGGRLIRSMLVGLAPSDAMTIALAVLTLSVVAVFAGYLPARLAARIDPMVALRYE